MKIYLIPIVLILLFASCVKEEIPACYQFITQMEVYFVHGEDIIYPAKPYCPKADTVCGFTEGQAKAYAEDRIYSNLPESYEGTVIIESCDGQKIFNDGIIAYISQTCKIVEL